MTDYKSLLEQAQKELQQAQQERAVLVSKINDLCLKLGLTNDDTLPEQIKSLRESLESQIKDTNSKIDSILNAH